MFILKRIPFYLLAFLIAPVMAGVTMSFSNMAELMIHKMPDAPPAGTAAPAARPLASAKKHALILLGTGGTEITDLLGAYGILSESGVFDVRTAAAHKRLLATTSDVGVMPDYTLAEAPKPDLLVIPSLLDAEEKDVLDYLRAHARDASQILVLGEGARVAARAGVFSHRNATTHFLALSDLERIDPTVHWIPGPRYVRDGNTISSSGVLSGLDATFFAIERAAGKSVAEQTAARLHYSWRREPNPSEPEASAPGRLSFSDYVLLLVHGGYDWSRKQIAAVVYPGVSELGLAAALDTFPRMQSARVYSMGAERGWIPTRHGLSLLPAHTAHDMAKTNPADLVVVPSGLGLKGTPPKEDPMQEPALHQYAVETQAAVKSALYDHPGTAFDKDLALVSELGGPRLAHLVAKLLVAPPSEPSAALGGFPVDSAPDWPLSLLIRPFLIGILGMWVVWIFDRMLFRRVTTQPT